MGGLSLPQLVTLFAAILAIWWIFNRRGGVSWLRRVFKPSERSGADEGRLAAGDILHIPAKIPHSFLVPKGKHITYVVVKFRAR
jgi:hypothetical protein